jgi:DNA-3-methyladenine glycosylase II
MSAGASFSLRYTPPFDWAFFLRYLETRSTPGVETARDGRYVRTIILGDAKGLLTVAHRARSHRLLVTVSGAAAERATRHGAPLIARVRRMFDLDADMKAMHRVLSADPRTAACVRASPGVRVPGAWSAFEVVCRAIVGQQISVKGATTIMGRIARRLATHVNGGNDIHGDQPVLLFPTPQRLARGDLRGIGMPGQRVRTLQNVAHAIANATIPLSDEDGDRPPTSMPSCAAVKEALLAQSGIGPWTAEYIALRALRDADAWPGTDLALRRALLPDPSTKIAPAALLDLSVPWRPWRAYAAVHLWLNASVTKSNGTD